MLDLSAPTVLFLDSETSGLLIDSLPLDDPGQPWCPQIAAAMCNDAGVFTNFFSHIIKADGRTIKDGALAVHGIARGATSKIGIPEPRVLGTLLNMISTAPTDRPLRVVTYGDFDFRVISGCFARYAVSQNKPSHTYDRQWHRRPLIEFVNLMAPYCQQACKLPSDFEDGGYKWPSLDEAAATLLGRAPREGYHDAFDDTLLLKDLYFHIRGLGWLPDHIPVDEK